jgi:hypothetical protein
MNNELGGKRGRERRSIVDCQVVVCFSREEMMGRQAQSIVDQKKKKETGKNVYLSIVMYI